MTHENQNVLIASGITLAFVALVVGTAVATCESSRHTLVTDAEGHRAAVIGCSGMVACAQEAAAACPNGYTPSLPSSPGFWAELLITCKEGR